MHNCKTSQRFCFFHLLLPLFVINSLWSPSMPLSKSALTITSSCVSIFSTPIFNYTSLSILKVLLTSLWLPLSFAVLSGSPAHTPSCCAFLSKRHTTFLLLYPHYSNSSSFLLKTTLCKGTTLRQCLVTWVGSHLRAAISLIAFLCLPYFPFCDNLCESFKSIIGQCVNICQAPWEQCLDNLVV